ncbi:hypothetical protein BRD01_13690 [Halobacteriales archaeon QS_8_65_32]|nr:MAG: hypothetical protein BRD01_13690 [Halobacteriales archaeon QS_8_65_32]
MGDEIFRDDHTFADDSSRVVLFAYRNESYPEGVCYRMQYYDTDTGETLLRYDNDTKTPRSAGTTDTLVRNGAASSSRTYGHTRTAFSTS